MGRRKKDDSSQNIGININNSDNGNIKIRDIKTGNIIITNKEPKITNKILPPSGTIGANPQLKKAIDERFLKLGQAREKRIGTDAYRVMYAKFNKDFGIKKKSEIWLWSEGRAKEIIDYLDQKYSNTIDGKLEKATNNKDYKHTRGHLFRMEKELLEKLDLMPKSSEVKEWLQTFFGVNSHAKITYSQHKEFIDFLERKVKEVYEEI